jgi:hypothetical protein
VDDGGHSKYHKVRILLILSFLGFPFQIGISQSVNYKDLFGEDWKKASAFEKENRGWMEPLICKYNISYPLAISIIFPELVRYSALRDKMEITLLKTLYVNLGEDYANFSIGVFQMKPSFAESIREQTQSVGSQISGIGFAQKTEFDDIIPFRKSIVKDLEDPKTEINYLIAFIKICDLKFKPKNGDELSRVRFLSTAYNYRIDKTAPEIESMSTRKFFNSKLFKTENYSYADVAVFWYNQYIKGL